MHVTAWTRISPPNDNNDANLDRISQIMAQISLTWCEPILMGSNAIGSKQTVLLCHTIGM